MVFSDQNIANVLLSLACKNPNLNSKYVIYNRSVNLTKFEICGRGTDLHTGTHNAAHTFIIFVKISIHRHACKFEPRVLPLSI